MPIPAERRRSFLARQVATISLSHVQVDTPMAVVRASAWSNSLMGVHLPLFVIHDINVARCVGVIGATCIRTMTSPS